MAVTLLVGNKLIYKYPTNYTKLVASEDRDGDPATRGETDSKCGVLDCEHLDCAIYAAERRSGDPSLLRMSGILFYFALVLALFGLPLGIGLAVVFGLYFVHQNEFEKNKTNALAQLLEFKEKDTVRGIPARQVYANLPKFPLVTAITIYLVACFAVRGLYWGYFFSACFIAAKITHDHTYMEGSAYKAEMIPYAFSPDGVKKLWKSQSSIPPVAKKIKKENPSAGKIYFDLYYPPQKK